VGGLVGVGPDRIGSELAATQGGALSFGSIVHVNEKGGCFGGTEEYIALLTSALAVRGVRSHLVCGLITGTVPADLSSVHVIDGLASRLPRSGTGDELARVIGELAPDVVYLHNVFDAGAVGAVATLANRGVLVWYVHDHYLTCLSELRWRRDLGSCPEQLGAGCLVAIGEGCCVLRYPERALGGDELAVRVALSRSMGEVDGVVVVSEYMRSLLADAAPQLTGRIHLLSRPIRDLGALRPRSRRHRRDPAVITYAGRITPEKGLAVLIEALAAARGDGPIELRIAGVVENDSYWSYCQRLQTTAMTTNPGLNVSYLGHLDYAAIDDLYRQSDIVAIPSQWPEPLGAVAIEAMSAGAAVIASNIGGLDTALVDNHNGVLVDPYDVTAWSAAVESLLHSPEVAYRLGAQAHADVAGITVADHLHTLDQMISHARRR
jgi:glycosyltransferase involved in cell wall biosynthesis